MRSLRNELLAACLLTGLAAGTGTSQLFHWASGGALHSAPLSGTEARKQPGAANQVELAQVASEPAEYDREAISASSSLTNPRPSLAVLLAEFPVPVYEPGDAEISGSVVRSDNTPVAGVRVTAIVRGTPPGVDSTEPDDLDLEGYVLQEIGRYHYDQAFRSSAWSDSSGRFVIRGIRTGHEYQLVASLDGWLFDTHWECRVYPGEVTRIRGFPAASVTIDAVRQSGAPEHFGWVAAFSDDTGESAQRSMVFWWDHRTPTLQIPVELPYLQFVAIDRVRSELAAVTLSPGSASKQRFVIRVPLSIRGNVAGLLPNRSRVVCVALGPGEGLLDVAALTERSPLSDSASESGRFSYFDLDPGRYQVSLVGPRRTLDDSRLVELSKTDVELTLAAAPDAEELLLVRAFDPLDEPVDVAQFEILSRSELGESRRNVPMQSTGAGAYTVLVEKQAWRGEEQVELIGRSVRYGTTGVPIRLGVREVVMMFESPATIEVVVTGVDDWRLRNLLRVRIGEQESTALAERASLVFGPLAPGDYKVQLFWQRTDWRGRVLSEMTTQVKPGANTAQIACPPLYRVVCEMAGAADGDLVTLERADARKPGSPRPHPAAFDRRNSGYARSRVSAERALFEFVPAGEYFIEGMSVRVAGDTAVTYQKPKFLGLRVGVLGSSGAMAGWGLRDGDLLMAVNGVTLDHDDSKRWAVPRPLLRKGKVSLEVLREGSSMSVTAHNEEYLSEESLGGVLEPCFER